MNIRTYIINLKESVDRRNYVLGETGKYPFMDVEIVEGVNGKLMDDSEIDQVFDVEKFRKRYGRLPVKGEIGCALSHRKCYHNLLSTTEPYALILEDDVSFICPEDTEYVISQGIKLLEDGKTDIVLFVPKALLYNRPHKINEKYTAYSVYGASGAYAYLINRRAMMSLLKCKRVSIVADDYIQIRKLGISLKNIYPNITEALDADRFISCRRWA